MKSDTDISLRLLQAIADNERLNQRAVASDLGIAVGLANAYIKRLLKRGLVKIQNVPPNRYLYYLTPQGFAEKSRLTSQFLSQSLAFFRTARTESSMLFEMCLDQGWTRLALVGKSELCEIAILGANDLGVALTAIVDAEAAQTTSTFMGIPVVAHHADIERPDAFMVTDLAAPQATFEELAARYPRERVLTIASLMVRREGEPATDDEPEALAK